MSTNLRISARAAFARQAMVVVVSFTLFVSTPSEAASTWYVKADAAHGGNGSRNKAFSTLQDVETVSKPGDTISIIPSGKPLDGGIQLKDGQRLIGLGDPVTKANPNSGRPTITNMTQRYEGDAIRLATNNVVQNIHIDGATRAGVFGVNARRAQIRNNLVTNNMLDGNNLRDLEARFILYQSQGNHFAGITLLACGTAASSYCVTHAPATPAIANTDQVVISGNVIRDSNLEGIMLLTDTGVIANYTVTDNLVRDLSQQLPRPESLTPPVGIVRSRAFTLIALNGSNVTLNMSRFHSENLAPAGNYASDGVVFLTGGDGPTVTAHVDDLVVLNPRQTGEVANGDSVEIQHRGSSNAVLNIDLKRAQLRDPASANIKVLEASNPSNGTYNIVISDSVLSNSNPAGIPDAQIRFSGASTGTKAFNLTVRNTKFSGIGGGIGVANPNNLENLRVLVENSSFADLIQPPGTMPISAVSINHPANRTLGTAIIDLGGGSLGSRGNNRFAKKSVADVSVTNSNSATAPIQVHAARNYWGGGAPVTAPAVRTAVSLTGNATFSEPTRVTTDRAR